MNTGISPQIIVATVFGVCLVFAALLAGTYTNPKLQAGSLATIEQTALAREAIDLQDSRRGIENWRDSLYRGETLHLSTSTNAEYREPDTLTGQFAVDFVEDLLISKTYGPLGADRDRIIDRSIAQMLNETKDAMVTRQELTIVPTTPESIRTYGNTASDIITEHNVESISEIDLLDRALRQNNHEDFRKIEVLSRMYQAMRNEYIATPVPEAFVQEHLDLINVFHMLHAGLRDMATALDDPMRALLRVQRYPDDAAGLYYALQNLALSLTAHVDVFDTSDSAALFTAFLPPQLLQRP